MRLTCRAALLLDAGAPLGQSQCMYRIIGSDGKEYGPIAEEQLRQWIGQGRANAETRAAGEGSAEWKRLASFPEFALLFGPAPLPRAGTLPAGMPIRRNNSFAVSGLVLAALSLCCCCCCCYGLPFNVVALILSIIGLVQIRSHPETSHGQGVAILGIVLSVLSILVSVALLLIYGFAGTLENLSHGVHRL